jgi:DNA-directed RNA polymerase specialized sigma24 family protein
MFDDEQFTKLYKKGFARTCDFFHKKGLSPEDCQDLAQEVFLNILRRRHRYDPQYSLVSFWWLHLLEIAAKLKAGRYSDPLDDLVRIRDSDFRGQHIIESEPDPVSSLETQVWMDQIIKQLPDLMQKDVTLILEDVSPTLYSADRYKLLGMKRLAYERQMARIHQDPRILDFIREELRND